MSRHRTFFVLLPALVLVGATAAAATDIPLQNWTVPSTSGKGRSALSDIGGTTTPFIPVTPCRIADTRDGSFPANFGPPSLVGGAVSRTFTIPAGPCTGIPALASAYSLNFTVVSPPVTPPGGYLTVWPTGAPKPVVSTLNFGAGSILANAAIVPAGTGGGINVFVNFSTDLIIDINGYYTIFMNANEQFAQVASIGNAAAIVGYNYSNTNGSHGVGGYAGGTGVVHGVQGQIGTGAAAGSSGVHGIGAATTGASYGVLGESFSTASNASGVRGIDRSPANSGGNSYIRSGVRGESANDIGVHGVSNDVAVAGSRHDSTGTRTAQGFVGYSTYAFYGSVGDYGGVGAKYFVEPYPLDASKVIRYVALEGPESGTYFRGGARTESGIAIIAVPDHFRMVSTEEGMTVHVTPVGQFTQIWVESVDLNNVVIRSSRDVEFHYIVHGIRRAFRDFNPITQGQEFMPQTPGDTLSPGLPTEIRERLITMGVYNSDGTVNMRTAERLGWDRVWEARAGGVATR